MDNQHTKRVSSQHTEIAYCQTTFSNLQENVRMVNSQFKNRCTIECFFETCKNDDLKCYMAWNRTILLEGILIVFLLSCLMLNDVSTLRPITSEKLHGNRLAIVYGQDSCLIVISLIECSLMAVIFLFAVVLHMQMRFVTLFFNKRMWRMKLDYEFISLCKCMSYVRLILQNVEYLSWT